MKEKIIVGLLDREIRFDPSESVLEHVKRRRRSSAQLERILASKPKQRKSIKSAPKPRPPPKPVKSQVPDEFPFEFEVPQPAETPIERDGLIIYHSRDSGVKGVYWNGATNSWFVSVVRINRTRISFSVDEFGDAGALGLAIQYSKEHPTRTKRIPSMSCNVRGVNYSDWNKSWIVAASKNGNRKSISFKLFRYGNDPMECLKAAVERRRELENSGEISSRKFT